MTPFHVGMKVVCVDDSRDGESHFWPQRPKKGVVYTVREVRAAWVDDNRIGLLLEELVNPYHLLSGRELGFYADRFRPVVKTDISIFISMLVPAPKQTVNA